jgi:hypothetical protein
MVTVAPEENKSRGENIMVLTLETTSNSFNKTREYFN